MEQHTPVIFLDLNGMSQLALVIFSIRSILQQLNEYFLSFVVNSAAVFVYSLHAVSKNNQNCG